MSKEIAIQAEDLQIGYQTKNGFVNLTEPFSFKIYQGELLAVIGLNGTGKSTLLRTLSDNNKYKGTIKIFSEEIGSLSVKQLAKQIASVSTSYQIQSYTKVIDVVGKGRSVHTNWIGTYEALDQKIIQESAQKVGVDHLLDQCYNTLSDGEKQRTLIAMALAQQANIILLDEPTAFIDYPNKYLLTALLKEITEKENKTVLFSSHDLEVVLSYADKILLFANNKLELLDKKEFLKEEHILKLFNHHQLSDAFRDNLIQHLLNIQREVD